MKAKYVDKENILFALRSIMGKIEACPGSALIECQLDIENTGLIEVPPFDGHGEWQEFRDLGGRHFEISIRLPNTKTLFEAMQENEIPKETNMKAIDSIIEQIKKGGSPCLTGITLSDQDVAQIYSALQDRKNQADLYYDKVVLSRSKGMKPSPHFLLTGLTTVDRHISESSWAGPIHEVITATICFKGSGDTRSISTEKFINDITSKIGNTINGTPGNQK